LQHRLRAFSSSSSSAHLHSGGAVWGVNNGSASASRCNNNMPKIGKQRNYPPGMILKPQPKLSVKPAVCKHPGFDGQKIKLQDAC
jgi:hypothetical protein